MRALVVSAVDSEVRWYGTLKYGDFHEKFNFLKIQDFKTLEHLSKAF